MKSDNLILFDAGLFIGALLKGDKRHSEAYPIVESARNGFLTACTTVSILSEVYAALTWIKAQPPQKPAEAASAIRILIEPPSEIMVLEDGFRASLKMLELAEKHNLTARRIHDARHAATALASNITNVFTYDINDWRIFSSDGIIISGPPTVLY